MRPFVITVFGTLALLVSLALLGQASAQQLPDAGLPIIVQISGNSMEPTLSDGAKVMCEAQEDYGVGDAVTFVKGDHLVSHRIIAELFDGYVTKGDGNLLPDLYLVEKENVLCKLVL
jgi:signal peptidase